MRTVFSIFLLLPGLLFAVNWSLEETSGGWNTQELVTLYYHNSDLQTQWAWKSLSHYSFSGDEAVLDFGSGDGKISAMISSWVPSGSVTGVDISAAMVSFASKLYPRSYYPNLEFRCCDNVDFSNQAFEQKFDLVTSFCVFHLIPRPIQVLEAIRACLSPNGKLVAAYPIGRNLEFFRAAQEELAIRGWNLPPQPVGPLSMRNPDHVSTILLQSGFRLDYFEIVKTATAFGSREELVDWFEGTTAANWNIPVAGRREFFEDVCLRYLGYRKDAVGEDGVVYFFLERIDLVASVSPLAS